ncbi:hypothetical protein BKA70DRAFT_1577742 [Coprinopsis sp. MPI-PUGE-AT-0042]|nr:hypothetical protein BKA70DRAFT_1577742 [Coprinopsis sp. MPI-PUGE-AT-0042]
MARRFALCGHQTMATSYKVCPVVPSISGYPLLIPRGQRHGPEEGEEAVEENECLRAEKAVEIAPKSDGIDLLAVMLKDALGQHDKFRKLSENKISRIRFNQSVDESERRKRILCDQDER